VLGGNGAGELQGEVPFVLHAQFITNGGRRGFGVEGGGSRSHCSGEEEGHLRRGPGRLLGSEFSRESEFLGGSTCVLLMVGGSTNLTKRLSPA